MNNLKTITQEEREKIKEVLKKAYSRKRVSGEPKTTALKREVAGA